MQLGLNRMKKNPDQQFRELISTGEDIYTYLCDLPELQKGEVHFRPTSNGVTMVGLHSDYPQRGHSGYDAAKLRAIFADEYPKRCLEIEQGRVTPEKQLQSYLIGNAYSHNRRMAAIQDAMPADDETNLYFVTDEISVATERGKVVCDILAIDRRPDGIAPVLMELKSERAMTRLIEQVENYSNVLKTYSEQYEALFAALLGEEIKFSRPLSRWIVWPTLDIGQPDPRYTQLLKQDIRVASYTQQGQTFQFRVD